MKCSDNFIGVFSSNNLDLKKCREKENFIAICNLSKKEQRGTHFVCLAASKSEIVYLDSFALPCTTSRSLHSSLTQLNRGRITELLKKPIQSSYSEYCGFFCMLFTALFDFKRFPNIKNMKPFSQTHLHNNDAICVENLKRIISENPLM